MRVGKKNSKTTVAFDTMAKIGHLKINVNLHCDVKLIVTWPRILSIIVAFENMGGYALQIQM